MYVTIEMDPNTGRAAKLVHEGTPSLDHMQKVVTGFIGTAARALGTKPPRYLQVWCNDDALVSANPPEHVAHLGATLRGEAYPMLGNLIVTGGNMNTGDTIPMDEKEVERVHLRVDRAAQTFLEITPL